MDFNAIVDTGFTGFISMQMVEALPLGLILSGTTTTILADGSESFKLTALGTATVDGVSRLGTVLLNRGSGPSDVLVGMEFIREFQKALLVSDQNVLFLDDIEISNILRHTS